MTKKDYELIAGSFKLAKIKYMLIPAKREAVNHAAKVLADAITQDNPRFDRDKFLKACGAE